MFTKIWLFLVIFLLLIRLYFTIQNKRGWGHDNNQTDILEND